jgi:hypothetical protein
MRLCLPTSDWFHDILPRRGQIGARVFDFFTETKDHGKGSFFLAVLVTGAAAKRIANVRKQ